MSTIKNGENTYFISNTFQNGHFFYYKVPRYCKEKNDKDETSILTFSFFSPPKIMQYLTESYEFYCLLALCKNVFVE